MAKLTDFTTPTGAKGNILDPSSWIGLILGSMVLLITFAVGQNLTQKVGSRAPFIDTTIDKPYVEPKQVSNSNKVEVI